MPFSLRSIPRLLGPLVAAAILTGAAAGAPATTAPARHALLVGISDYTSPYPSRKDLHAWPRLHSELDVENVRQVLLRRYGFRDDEILVLHDLRATQAGKPVPGLDTTRRGITEAFRRQLIQSARPGDVCVFYYAGHGQQIPDDNGDFDEPDGLDESLVTYDFISGKATDGDRSNLRDDDIQKLLKELCDRVRGPSTAASGSVTCIFDCCHSGTIVRGDQLTRGRGWMEAIDGPRPPAHPAAPGAGGGFLRPAEALAHGYVLLTACQSHESAFELQDERTGKPLGGVFTVKLCEALREAPAGTSYRELFERVRAEVRAVRPVQTPTLEGEIHQPLFRGLAPPVPAYPLVLGVHGRSVTLGAGRLHAVTEGSRFALFPAGTEPKGHSPLAEVRVESVDVARSTALLTPAEVDALAPAGSPAGTLEHRLRGARAVLVARAAAAEALRVLLDPADPLATPLMQAAPPEGFLRFLPPAGDRRPLYDVRLDREPSDAGQAAVVLRRDDDTLVARVPAGPLAAAQVRERLLGEWRWRFLSHLRAPAGSGSFGVRLRLVPVEAVPASGAEAGSFRVVGDRKDAPTPGGRLRLREGDFLQVEVSNPGPSAVYVTVLDLQPNGSVTPVFPAPGAPVLVENRIPGGGRLRLPGALAVGPPFGTDLFKAIATREPVDLSPLLDARALQRSADGHAPAEELLRHVSPEARPLALLLWSAATGLRGGAPAVTPGSWATADAELETQPK